MPKMKVPGLSQMTGKVNVFPTYEAGNYVGELVKSEYKDESETKGYTMYVYKFKFIDEPEGLKSSVMGKELRFNVTLLDESHGSFSQDLYEKNLNQIANLYISLGLPIKNDDILIGNELDNKGLKVGIKISAFTPKQGKNAGVEQNGFEFYSLED